MPIDKSCRKCVRGPSYLSLCKECCIIAAREAESKHKKFKMKQEHPKPTNSLKWAFDDLGNYIESDE